MPQRSLNLGPEIWEKLRLIKKELDLAKGKAVPWDDAFNHILSFVEKAGGLKKSSKKRTNEDEIADPNPSFVSVPSPINPPNLADLPPISVGKGLAAPKIGIVAPKMPSKVMPKLEIKLPKAGSVPKISAPKLGASVEPFGDTDDDLGIPPPPRKKVITLDIETSKLEELAKKDTADTKFILIECQICGSAPIMMPVPKKIVIDSTEPVVDVSYIHGNPSHVVVAQLDHDFQVRRRRASWPVFEKDFKK